MLILVSQSYLVFNSDSFNSLYTTAVILYFDTTTVFLHYTSWFDIGGS